jgi:tetratricopeptide (TPR) repeat protein
MGVMHELLGDDKGAENAYERLLQVDPSQIVVVDRLLSLLRREGRLVDAEGVLNRVPDRLRTLFILKKHRIGIALGTGDVKTAVQELEEYTRARPEDLQAGVLLARALYLDSGDAKRSLSLLDQIQSNPDAPFEAIQARAAILHDEGQDAEALQLLDEAVQEREDFQRLLARAQFNTTLGRFDAAEADFQRLASRADLAPQGHELLGRFYAERGRYEDAVAAWEAGLEIVPDDASLKRRIIGLLIERPDRQQRERALAMTEELLEQSPGAYDLLTLKAMNATGPEAAGAIESALAALQKAVTDNPRNEEAQVDLIRLLRHKGDVVGVREAVSRALGVNKRSARLLLLAGSIEGELGNLSDARSYAEQALQLEPGNLKGRSMLMTTALAEGDLDLADRLAKELLADEPGFEEALLAQAGVLEARGQRGQAIDSLTDYYTAHPDAHTVRSLLFLARLYLSEEQFDKSAALIDLAEKLDPVNLNTLRLRLTWLNRQGQYEKIPSVVDRWLEQSPDKVSVLTFGAAALMQSAESGSLALAVDMYQQLTRVLPNNANAHVTLAQVAYRAGNLDTAEKAYRRALELNPYNPIALNDLSWMLAGGGQGTVEQDRLEEAIELATRGTARYPDNPHLLDTRGAILLELGRLEEARKDLEKCASMKKAPPATRISALRHLARLHMQRNEPEKARARYAEALEIDRQAKVLSEKERKELEQKLDALPQ